MGGEGLSRMGGMIGKGAITGAITGEEEEGGEEGVVVSQPGIQCPVILTATKTIAIQQVPTAGRI